MLSLVWFGLVSLKLLARVGNIFVVLVKFCCVSRNQRKKRNVLVVVDVVIAVVVSVVVVTVVFGFWVNVNVNVMRPARLVCSGLVCSVWPVSCRHHLLYDLMYVCLRRTLEAFHKGHKVAETPRYPLFSFAAAFCSPSFNKLQPAPQ